MGKEITIMKSCTGINNLSDPARLKFDAEKGISELQVAVNVEIDETGRISRRKGTNLLVSLPNAHSLFVYRNDCFVCADGNLYRTNPDFSLLGLRSGLNVDAPMSFSGIGDKIFYCNGYENGYIELGGVSYPWVKDSYTGPLDTRKYYDPPVGHLVEITHSRSFIAEASTLWYSEPFAYSLFRKSTNFYQLGSRITMLAGVDAGMYVGDQEGVYFFDLEHGKHVVSNSKPFVGAVAKMPHKTISNLEMNGTVAVWASPDGIFIGSSTGQVVNVTENVLSIPDGHVYGSILLRDDGFIMTSIF